MTAQVAKDPVNSIEFYTFEKSEEANDSFLKTKEFLKGKEPDLFDRNGFSLKEYTFYSQRKDGTYTFIARLGNTILFCQTPEKQEKEVQNVIKKLGYL